MPGFNEIRDYDDVIDEVMEWIGRKWTTGMIKMSMREVWPGIKVSTIHAIIARARKKICKLYNIDPNEYKGSQISFYEAIIRSKAKTHDKLKAAERLDALFGLENVSGVDPADLAAKIRQFRQEMDTTIEDKSDGGNKNGGQGKTNTVLQTNDARESGSKEDSGTGTSSKIPSEDNEDNADKGPADTQPADSVVDSEKTEIIEDLTQCDQRLQDMKTKPQKDPDNI